MCKPVLFCLALLLVLSVTAQPVKKKNPVPAEVKEAFNWAPGALVYERPGYQGRSAYFRKNTEGQFEFPFPLNHVSLKIPEGRILYIRNCTEFPSETAYPASLRDVNLELICGVRMDSSTGLRITLTGISTELHNRDCLRFGGKIEVKVIETAPDLGSVESLMQWNIVERPAPWRNPDRFTFLIYKDDSVLISRPGLALELNSGYIFNNDPVPHLTDQARYGSRVKQNSTNIFTVGRSALREGRVRIWVKTDLVSAHKTCDLCDDFTNNVRMREPGYTIIPVNKPDSHGHILSNADPYVIVGPFTAYAPERRGYTPSPAGGLAKHFRVHLKIKDENAGPVQPTEILK